eukprot:s580_g19.t2
MGSAGAEGVEEPWLPGSAVFLTCDPQRAMPAGPLCMKSRLTRQRSKSTELFWHTQYELLKHSGATVDRKTFMLWLQEPAFLHVLESADVDVSNKFDLFDVLDSDSWRLDLASAYGSVH